MSKKFLQLKALRLKAGFLRQEDMLASSPAPGISLAQLGNLERGAFTRLPREKTLTALSTLLGVSMRDLYIIFNQYLNAKTIEKE